MRLIFSFFLFVMLCATLVSGQGFSGQVFSGLTFAQLEGDNLAGFSKFGIHGGVQVSYNLTEKFDLGIEMSYSEKGSREGYYNAPQHKNITTLQYFELPVIASIKDWYIEDDDYYKIKGHLGVSYGYLFAAESENELFLDGVPSFKESDIGFLCGATFMINRRLGITARYQRSFTQFYKSDDLITGGLLSYLWTLRAGFHF